jgi:hypothetical protein
MHDTITETDHFDFIKKNCIHLSNVSSDFSAKLFYYKNCNRKKMKMFTRAQTLRNLVAKVSEANVDS